MFRSIVVLTLLALAAPATAAASFPGPDGRIVFEGDPAHGSGWLFTASGAGTGIAPFGKATTARADPAYSADGRWVAFTEARDIWIARSDGKGAPVQVTRDGANDSQPAFSPDGRRIAFVRGIVGSGDIFVVHRDGTGLVNLSLDADRIDDAPDWSPDGKRIAFAGNPCFTGGALTPQGGPCVFVMNADGTGKVNLTPEEKRAECNPDAQLPGYSHAHHSSDPSWSPDGTRIAFTGYFDICTHDSGGASDIWVMNPDGSGKTDLISDQGTPDEQPAWSPSGAAIAFVSDRDGARGLFRVAGAGGAVTRLTSGQDADPNWGRTAVRCRVPKLKGRRPAAAKRAIRKAGCLPGRITKKRGGRKGRVLSSRPAARKRVPAWTKVTLVVGR
jgi:Tol biopolymer transport system component